MIQLQVLNKILDTKDASIISLNNLTDEYFSDYINEFRFIKSHIDAYGNCPDKETFLAKFPDFDIIKVSEGVPYLVDALYDDKNKRSLAKVFNKVRELLNEDNVDEAMKVYFNASSSISTAKNLTAVDIYEDTKRYDEYVDKIANFNKHYVKTGFTELDTVLGGWDRKEELATIIARPGNGKSMMLFKMTVAAAEQGLTVGIYSGEMGVSKVGYRIDTLISHISNTKLNHGNGDVQAEYKRFLEGRGNLKGKIFILTPEMVGGSAGVSTLRAFVEKYKLDMLFVDQHSLLDDDRHAKNPVERAANISKDLKVLQTLLRIPIITVSQQNRESTENGVSVANVAQSDRIGQDSTVVIALEKKDTILSMHIIKARDGGDGRTLKYVFDFDKGIFRYMPAEGDATGGEGIEDLKNEYEYTEGEEVF